MYLCVLKENLRVFMFRKIIFLSSIFALLISCNGDNYSKTDDILKNYQMNVCNNLNSSFYKYQSKSFYAIEITNIINGNNKLFYKKALAINLDKDCMLNESNFTEFEVGDTLIKEVNQLPIKLNQGYASSILNNISSNVNLKGYYAKSITDSKIITKIEDEAMSNDLNLKSINCQIKLESISKCTLNAGSLIETKFITFDNVTYPDYHLLFIEKNNNSEITKRLGYRGNITLKIENGKDIVAYLNNTNANILSNFDVSKTNVYVVYSRYITSYQNENLYLVNYNHSMNIPLFNKIID